MVFDTTVEHLGAYLELDTFYATSKLEFDTAGKFLNLDVAKDDSLTKVQLLKKYLLATGKSATDCIPVGDSSNDIPLFDFTKNGITFDWSKDDVKAAATYTISTLTDLLEIL